MQPQALPSTTSLATAAGCRSDGFEPVTVSTDSVKPDERAEFWRHVIATDCPMDIVWLPGHDIRGTKRSLSTVNYTLDLLSNPCARAKRTQRHIHRDCDDRYRLTLHLGGSMTLETTDRTHEITPGVGAFVDLGSPMDMIITERLDACVLKVPAAEVTHRLSSSSPVHGDLDLTTGLGRIIVGMVVGLQRESDNLTAASFDAVCDRVVELVCMLVVGDDRPTTGSGLPEVEALVRSYVLQHAADPDLSGAHIAHAIGWSLRQVQLALQQAGTTPRELIRDVRLQAARRRLRDPAYGNRSIGEIAAMSGFATTSSFSSAFRRRYGQTPRSFRSDARSSHPA
jgi:AraC-like DNA-binding protein